MPNPAYASAWHYSIPKLETAMNVFLSKSEGPIPLLFIVPIKTYFTHLQKKLSFANILIMTLSYCGDVQFRGKKPQPTGLPVLCILLMASQIWMLILHLEKRFPALFPAV